MRLSMTMTLLAAWHVSALAFPISKTRDEPNPRRPGMDLERRGYQSTPYSEYQVQWEDNAVRINRALRRDRAFKARVSRSLGLNNNDWDVFNLEYIVLQQSEPIINEEDVNNALRQAGWEGPFLPRKPEVLEDPEDQREAFMDETMRVYRLIQDHMRRDPDFLRKLRVALGLSTQKPDGPLPAIGIDGVTISEYNRALGEAGYTGPPFPLDPEEKRGRRASKGPQTPPGGRPKGRLTLVRNPPRPGGFLASTVQALGHAVGEKLHDTTRSLGEAFNKAHGRTPSMSDSTSPSQPHLQPLFPGKMPLVGALGLIK
ncbi:MAG: hypothetical protein M1816_000561 [Peltula sp. TS41687]|nr:MAG: hypothetical protein M1816_000561 [Peltula sp. TS41687]